MAREKPGKKAKKGKDKDRAKPAKGDLPKVIRPATDTPAIETEFGPFDLDDPILPAWIDANAFKSGGYPYDEPIKDKQYQEDLVQLQIELVKLQQHVVGKGQRIVALFEGRDAAGKGGAIFAFEQYLNPRCTHSVALPKPNDVERGQWYFQRYAEHLPSSGEIVLFDRSWYNRAGVEPVMGFCTEAEHEVFLAQAPKFERMLIDQGIAVFKFWLSISRLTQLKRFHERRHNPLKIWKLSPIDYASLGRWDAYTKARDQMFEATHTDMTPWLVVRANDKRRARLNIIRQVLGAIPYEGRDETVVRKPDPLIVGKGPDLLAEG